MPKQAITQAMLPVFSEIDTTNIVPSLKERLDHNRAEINSLLAQQKPFTWENLMQPMEDMHDELNKFWAPIGHLHGVMETEALRKAYNDAIPLLTAYETELSQNEALCAAVASIAASEDFNQLTPAQQKIIKNELRDFKLAGVDLPADKKAHMAELEQKLSNLMTKFSENLLDATNSWNLHVADEKDVAGLPPQAKERAKQSAAEQELDGYLFGLDYPSYSAALKYLDNRELRQKLYEAHTTRASEIGPDANKFNNNPIMEEMLQVRHDMAKLVGFDNFAEYSLATKMAKNPNDVLHFLNDLVEKSHSLAKQEINEVAKLAANDGIETMEAWDVAYYSEKLQASKFHFTPEDLRPYFPFDKVFNGMFDLIQQIYGLTIQEQTGMDVWHPDVKFFTVHDQHGVLRGGFYTDLYARPHKREGAWMDECRSRRLENGFEQYPVAFLTCNFMPPVKGKPGLLTHDDVLTVFHEFGHCLHHMLTKVDFPSVGGINGVPWDAVEFPSQFLENFCWEKDTLQSISSHYKTGEPLPDELYEKLNASRHFQTGMMMVRQLEFALFDFRLHMEYVPGAGPQVQKILDDVRSTTTVIPVPEINRFQNSFGHIFGGGYAAGYYSYKWAEVLSADAYAAFEESGIYNREIGIKFMENILEVGGVRDPMESFVAFRGREPKIDALLRHSGIN